MVNLFCYKLWFITLLHNGLTVDLSGSAFEPVIELMIESFTFDIPGEFGGTKNASWSSVRVFPPIFDPFWYEKLFRAIFRYDFSVMAFFDSFCGIFLQKILFSLTLWMKEFSEWVIFVRARVPLPLWVWQLSYGLRLLWNNFWTLYVCSCYVHI